MTDLEKFIELYRSVGIELQPIQRDGLLVLRLQAPSAFLDTYQSSLIQGYDGFTTDIEFSPEGKFIRQVLWE